MYGRSSPAEEFEICPVQVNPKDGFLTMSHRLGSANSFVYVCFEILFFSFKALFLTTRDVFLIYEMACTLWIRDLSYIDQVSNFWLLKLEV